jgi:hypothetical protein
MKQISNEYMMTWHVQPLTNASRAAFPLSSFTACLNDLAVGHTDLCIGDFWATAQRRALMGNQARFLHTISNDQFHLVTHPAVTVKDSISKFFTMATPRFWAAILSLTLAVSTVFHFIEAQHVKNHEWTITERVATSNVSIANGFYELLLGLAGQNFWGDMGDIKSTEGKLLKVSFSVFALAFITSFTGTVAAAMVTAQVGRVDGIQAATEQDQTICVMQAITAAVRGTYPMAKIFEVGDNDEALRRMDDGMCDVAFLPKDNWLDQIMTSDKHCDKLMVPSLEFAMPCTVAVRQQYAGALSWVIADMIANGEYESSKSAAQETYWRALGRERECDAADSTLGVKTAAKLDVLHILGPMLIVLVLAGVAAAMGVARMLGCGAAEAVADFAEAASMRVQQRPQSSEGGVLKRTTGEKMAI